RAGRHRTRMPELTPPFVLGWDLAGTVIEIGSGASGYAVGDPVVGLVPWIQAGGRVGTYAEAVAVDPAWLAPRPAQLGAVIAATIPLNGLTARQALDLIAAPAGSRLLITGASGAVGSFATQLAVAEGLEVIAIASDGDEGWVSDLGPSEVLGRASDLAALDPVDAVLDAVPIGPPAVVAVRDGGTAVFTRRVGELPPGRRLRVETPLVHPDQVALARLARQVTEQTVRTRVAGTFALAEAAAAHRLAERGRARGKFVLTTDQEET
ncbi:MAG TPA: NADP-dependent oxidoreductase, partial [Solirubrobacteraceae bacterium]